MPQLVQGDEDGGRNLAAQNACSNHGCLPDSRACREGPDGHDGASPSIVDLMSYPNEVAIDPACLARLVGRYQMNDWAFDVTATGDRLHVPIGDQHRVFPTSEWHFFHKSAPVQLTFEPGADRRAVR